MSKRFAMVVSSLILSAGVALADTYQIDPAHTTVGFSIKHMVINNVHGRFADFKGTVEYDGKDVASVKASGTIEAKSVDTGIKQRDDHLRSPDFFDVAKYPEISFSGQKVQKQGDRYVLVGKFTMHGVTKDVSLPVTVNGPIVDPYGKSRIGIEIITTLNRQDYGINWSKTLDNGGLVVGDDVKIEISAEAVKQVPEAKK